MNLKKFTLPGVIWRNYISTDRDRRRAIIEISLLDLVLLLVSRRLLAD
jgi:hypothetical protein